MSEQIKGNAAQRRWAQAEENIKRRLDELSPQERRKRLLIAPDHDLVANYLSLRATLRSGITQSSAESISNDAQALLAEIRRRQIF